MPVSVPSSPLLSKKRLFLKGLLGHSSAPAVMQLWSLSSMGVNQQVHLLDDHLGFYSVLGGDAIVAGDVGALEETLCVRFEGDRSAAFFHSTLVQSLFYGGFFAWVLLARQSQHPPGRPTCTTLSGTCRHP
jgi:hypothetical protein